MKPLLIILILISLTSSIFAHENKQYRFKLDVEIFDIKNEKVVGEIHIKLTPLTGKMLSDVIRALSSEVPVEVKLLHMNEEPHEKQD